MLYYTLKKLVSMCLTLLLVSVITFGVFELIPGDPIATKLGIEAEPEQIEALREAYGLNDPLPIRYARWAFGALKGDFGRSIRFDAPVSALIGDRIKVTFLLAIMSIVLVILMGVPLSIVGAKYYNKPPDAVISITSQLGMAIPSFWLGILITYVFGLVFKWFTPGRYVAVSEDWRAGLLYMLFPAFAIAIPRTAIFVRYLKNGLVEQRRQHYVRTAYAKGMTTDRILYRHVLRNALIPVITIMGMMVAGVLGGSLIIEQVFSVPGIGRLLIMAVTNRDYILVQGMVMYIAAIVILIHFLIDILYVLVDPRIQFSKR